MRGFPQYVSRFYRIPITARRLLSWYYKDMILTQRADPGATREAASRHADCCGPKPQGDQIGLGNVRTQ